MPEERSWFGVIGSMAEHRTVGYRAWCFDCGEWCYPSIHCPCCAMFTARSTGWPEWLG